MPVSACPYLGMANGGSETWSVVARIADYPWTVAPTQPWGTTCRVPHVLRVAHRTVLLHESVSAPASYKQYWSCLFSLVSYFSGLEQVPLPHRGLPELGNGSTCVGLKTACQHLSTV